MHPATSPAARRTAGAAADHAPRGPVYRPDIDGLRAVAVLAVVAYHAFPAALPGGFVGVDVFFVISGFLITALLLDGMATGPFSFRAFYLRRARRLFPALALVLASCLAAGWWLLVPDQFAALGRHVVASALFVANLAFWRETGYFTAAAETLPLLHLWSLGIEEQFYLLWPPALLLARRRGIDLLHLALVAAGLSLLACLVLTAYHPASAFYLPFTRFWELLAGGLLAHGRRVPAAAAWWRARPPRVLDLAALGGLGLVLGACALLDAGMPYPGWRALPAVLGAVLLVAAGPDTWLARQLLARRAVVGIGLVSYPLYLWHWPLLSFARIDAAGEVDPWLRAGLLVASLALAVATWRLVERPLRFGLPPRRALALLLPAMALVTVAGAATLALRGFAGRADDVVRPYVDYHYDYRAPSREGLCSLTGAAGEPARFPPDCVDRATSPPRPLVVLWGDSHAAMLYPGLRAVGGTRLRLAQFTRSGCPPYLATRKPICNASNADVLGRIGTLRPEHVVLFAHWTGNTFQGPAQVARDLDATVAALHARGAGRVAVVGPAPKWQGRLPHVLVRLHAERPYLRAPRRLRHGGSRDVFALDAALQAHFGTRDDVTYVSALGRLCDARGCLTYIDDDPRVLSTWDYGHLAPRAAEVVAAQLEQQLGGFVAGAQAAGAAGTRR